MNKLLKISSMIMLGAAVLFTGCKSDDDDEKTYTVTLNVEDSTMGTVVGDGEYTEGMEISIVATAKKGYHFTKWSDGNTSNPRTLIVNKSISLIAFFAEGESGNGGGNATDPVSIDGGEINENTVWKDLGLPVDYIINDGIRLNGNALVTIEPGVTIMFANNNGGIFVGENAGLKAVGTEEKPIVFTGPTNNQNTGSWGSIKITSKRNDNALEYVTFKNGGSDDGKWDAVIDIEGGKVSIKNCTIEGSLSHGILLESSAKLTAFEGNKISKCEAYPIYIEDAASVLSLEDTNNTFASNNKHNVVGISGASISNTEKNTLKALSIPYYFEEGLYLNDAQTFTIEPGTILKLGAGKFISIEEDVTFIAKGTATAHIVFDGYEEEAGYWEGIRYYSKKANSTLSYCDLKNGGYGESDEWHAALIYINDINSKGTIENCTFSNSQNYGICIYNIDETTVAISGDSYKSCAEGNVIHWSNYEEKINERQTFENAEALKKAIE